MAKSDAITDYSNNGMLSTADMIPGALAVWEANKGNAIDFGLDHAWSGDTTAAPGTALSGWDVGTWKYLRFSDCPYDPSYQLPEHTAAHSMLRHIKTSFNLPSAGSDADWADDFDVYYSALINGGEFSGFLYQAKECVSHPMVMSRSSMVGENTTINAWPSGNPEGVGTHWKCMLYIGLQGWALDVGVERSMSITVRPNDTNITNYNAHYKALADASTATTDYTDPALEGTEYTEVGNILLVNCENQFRFTTLNTDTDRMWLQICWNSHSYAQIKALMDATMPESKA